MKATGMVRRVDDWGRVIIPNEIRRSMGIRDGEPMEIFTSDEGVFFRKYSPDYPHKLQVIADELRDNAHICNYDDKHWQLTYDITNKLYEVAGEIRQLEAE